MIARPQGVVFQPIRTASLLLALGVLSVVSITPSPSPAQEMILPGDVSAIVKGVIAEQLDAFKADDGERALSFAAPSIRSAFPTADIFMGMVRSGYAPVYRPAQVTFGIIKSEGDQAVQEVYVTDPAGEEWLATYTLARQPDGSWKITGCYLRRDPGSGA